MGNDTPQKTGIWAKLLKMLGGIILLGCVIIGGIGLISDFCEVTDFSCRFHDWNWCEDDDSPEPTAELTISLLADDNQAGLQIEILPGSSFRVGDIMQMRLSSNHDGYLLVLDINSEGALTTLFPNQFSEKQGYLKAGQTLTIPNVYYGFDFLAKEPIGTGTLIAVLIEDELTIIRDALPVPFKEIKKPLAQIVVQQLRKELEQSVQDENGIAHPVRWSGTMAEYQITH
jgi:hypothetical protein